MKIKSCIPCLIFLNMIVINPGFGGEASSANLKEEKVTYSSGDKTFNGVIVYDQNREGKRPAVLVVHEWWGLTDYPIRRARELARLGYIALAVDMYGDGKVAGTPEEARELATQFYKDPQKSKIYLEAALEKLKRYKQVDNHNIFAIGYCFGGSVVLNSAKLGLDFKGVVSFHGGLAGVPASKGLLKAKILVCHGGSDKFISDNDISTFRQQLDSIGADYKFIVYPNATHAFTNPESTNTGKKFNMPIEYNPIADKDSWNDMKLFFTAILKK